MDNTGTVFGVAHNGSRFVAVGSNGRMAFSDNGVNWTAVANSTFPTDYTGLINGIVWGEDKFVAVGVGFAAYSSDGVSWKRVNLSSALGSNGMIQGIAFGDGVFAAINKDGSVAVSEDGVAWEAAEEDVYDITEGVIAYGGGRFLAAGSNGKMAYSDDMGQTWTYVANSSFPTDLYGVIHSLAYGNGKFIAGGAGRIAYSSDGETWTQVTSSEWRTHGVRAIAFDGESFVAGGDTGKMESSVDGVNWKPVIDSGFPSDITGTIYGIASSGAGKFVAVGGNGRISYSR